VDRFQILHATVFDQADALVPGSFHFLRCMSTADKQEDVKMAMPVHVLPPTDEPPLAAVACMPLPSVIRGDKDCGRARLPFEVKVRDAKTRKAVQDLEAGKGNSCPSVDAWMADLYADDWALFHLPTGLRARSQRQASKPRSEVAKTRLSSTSLPTGRPQPTEPCQRNNSARRKNGTTPVDSLPVSNSPTADGPAGSGCYLAVT